MWNHIWDVFVSKLSIPAIAGCVSPQLPTVENGFDPTVAVELQWVCSGTRWTVAEAWTPVTFPLSALTARPSLLAQETAGLQSIDGQGLLARPHTGVRDWCNRSTVHTENHQFWKSGPMAGSGLQTCVHMYELPRPAKATSPPRA